MNGKKIGRYSGSGWIRLSLDKIIEKLPSADLRAGPSAGLRAGPSAGLRTGPSTGLRASGGGGNHVTARQTLSRLHPESGGKI